MSESDQPRISPVVLAALERGHFDGRQERLVFERSEFRGKQTHWLRIVHRATRGGWSWALARPSSAGHYWQSMCLRGRELRALGNALLAAADALEHQGVDAQPAEPVKPARLPNKRELAELARFDAERTPSKSTDDIPF